VEEHIAQLRSQFSSYRIFLKGAFHMPTTIATEQGVPTARLRRTAYVFLRSRLLDFLLVVWAITVLLIGAHASFGGRPFLSAFDVSVAPF
jgi:hypothetical protein